MKPYHFALLALGSLNLFSPTTRVGTAVVLPGLHEQMSEMLAWMEDNYADGEEAMFYFFNTYPDLWKGWVSEDVAVRIEKAL